MNQLPIDQVLPRLKAVLQETTSAVLVASPGAGKTTRVPLSLLDEPWLAGRKILMLTPRRLAARASASFMATLLGEKVGETVGYRVKMDAKVGPHTRIEVITEGVLTRMLQADPALEGVGLILFDEFHERNLNADLGLALSLQARSLFCEDLRILIMSATLDAEPVAALLGDAPVLVSEGRQYPVETRFLARPLEGRVEPELVKVIGHAHRAESGDILVFLPGVGEIRRVEALLQEAGLDAGTQITPLYGALSQEAQDRAIRRANPGVRKIVLSTSIAETSLTVEGVRIVIDSGLMRVPRFSPRTGMTRLETIKVSKASADQRRGRAGRLESGICYRMWTEQEDRVLIAQQLPEIKEADLAPLALELAAWGVADTDELSWLDLPPKAAMAQAGELLQQLGAMDAGKRITQHGRQLAQMGLHPRLGHMIWKSGELGLRSLACELAVLIGERDIVRGRGATQDADLQLRVELLRVIGHHGHHKKMDRAQLGELQIDEGVCRRIWEEAAQLKRQWAASEKQPLAQASKDVSATGRLLALAYPDRIAQRRGDGRYLLRNGRGAAFAWEQPLAYEKYVVAAMLDDQGADSRITLAARLEESDLEHDCASEIREEHVWWERSTQSVRARIRKHLGALTIWEAPSAMADPDAVLHALLGGIAEQGLDLLPWDRHARQLAQRLQFMHKLDAAWPDASEEALIRSLPEWLGPHVYGWKRLDELRSLSLSSILESMLSWDQRRELDENAPTHIVVPSGSRIPVDYSHSGAPVLSVRLQELFGWQDTPRIGRGRVPLTLHLLSPAHRPVQVTQDLSSFWKNTYFEVKKDLKGRYPKHYWPDDPLQAMPTNRTRPRPRT
ncbi:ATP-dependent helicase HrpB [Brevibacillus reuszeri]|uniref:ATP-dependent helicase n=1 Tax=Brevibacillus reuszeri TaxID=54915 RepID=A0A0K9YZ54_9BACL|nr:ATP-dependent helicase HrpB [Brevibacillus reuszeri]KNB73530.1 ATP-dependent helicase [Brevibacillus reuszeri]MED1858674.1 ATP-dependent helicase HrpB [Brevibacillus reuszeri]GED69655.1 ATP-dependent helicase HrpB [Brevibacillus reuszeri]